MRSKNYMHKAYLGTYSRVVIEELGSKDMVQHSDLESERTRNDMVQNPDLESERTRNDFKNCPSLYDAFGLSKVRV